MASSIAQTAGGSSSVIPGSDAGAVSAFTGFTTNLPLTDATGEPREVCELGTLGSIGRLPAWQWLSVRGRCYATRQIRRSRHGLDNRCRSSTARQNR